MLQTVVSESSLRVVAFSGSRMNSCSSTNAEELISEQREASPGMQVYFKEHSLLLQCNVSQSVPFPSKVHISPARMSDCAGIHWGVSGGLGALGALSAGWLGLRGASGVQLLGRAGHNKRPELDVPIKLKCAAAALMTRAARCDMSSSEEVAFAVGDPGLGAERGGGRT